MPSFSSLPATQTDLDKFLTFFQENFRVFQENSLADFKKVKFLVLTFICQLTTHVHAKFQLSSYYPDGLRQIFDLFPTKIQDFLKENSESSKSEQSSESRFPKGNYYQNLSHLAFY
jgi:hypothetical protein